LGQPGGHFLHGLGVPFFLGQVEEHFQILYLTGLAFVAFQGVDQGASFLLQLSCGLNIFPETGSPHFLINFCQSGLFLFQLKESLEGL
jgi:hypothetical protein